MKGLGPRPFLHSHKKKDFPSVFFFFFFFLRVQGGSGAETSQQVTRTNHSPVNWVYDERYGTQTDRDHSPFPGLLRQQVAGVPAEKEPRDRAQPVYGESGNGHGGQALPHEGVCNGQRGCCCQLSLRAHRVEGGGGVWRP